MDRRTLLTGMALSGVLPAVASAQGAQLELGPETLFNFDQLIERARKSASQPKGRNTS